MERTDHGTVTFKLEVPEWVAKHFHHNRRTIQNFLCDAMQLHINEISIELETHLQELKEFNIKLCAAKREELKLMVVIENEST